MALFWAQGELVSVDVSPRPHAILLSFAAMFPDKIERVILDGVVNSHDYYASESHFNVTFY